MFLTATCFGSSYRAIFRLSPKSVTTHLTLFYRVGDLVLHVINIYYGLKIDSISNFMILKTFLYYSPCVLNCITYNY